VAFFSLSLVRIGVLGALGQYTMELVAVGLGLALPSILAQQAGLWFKGRLPERTLYRAVLAVLFVAGLNLLWRAIGSLAATPGG
jgi:uncharacterized membrane protein YfcA